MGSRCIFIYHMQSYLELDLARKGLLEIQVLLVRTSLLGCMQARAHIFRTCSRWHFAFSRFLRLADALYTLRG